MTAPAPQWLVDLSRRAQEGPVPRELRPPDRSGRRSAILVLFGPGPSGPDVLLTQRSDGLRHHAGQPAFPGGSVDPADADATACALREAVEETALDPRGVQVLAELPEVYLSFSGFRVTPVLAWWWRPGPVFPVDAAEVASVARVPIAELLDPDNQRRVRYPGGLHGPAYKVRGMVVWGFTAAVLDGLLRLAGWIPETDTEAPEIDVTALRW